MPVTFDDLIPQKAQADGFTTFADLIPSFQERLEKPVAPLIPSQTADQAGFIPLRQGAGGVPAIDPQAGVLGALLRAITTPGDVFRGTIPTPYSPGASAEASPDVINRAGEFASFFSPVSPSYRAGARYGTTPPLPAPPSAKDIKTTAGSGFNSVRESGLEVPSSLVNNLVTDIRTGYGERFSPSNAENTFARLDMMANPKRSGTSMAALLDHRDDLNATIARGGSDMSAAIEAKVKLDQFLDNLGQANTRPTPGMTPTMLPEDVNATLQTARANDRAARAANLVSGELDPAAVGFVEKAEGRAGTPGSRTVDAQLRDRARALLESNNNIRTFQPEEVEALKGIRDGTPTRNALAWYGRKFGGVDLGSMALSGLSGGLLGGALGHGGPGMSAIAVVLQGGGILARAVANALAKGQTQLAEELARRGSPLGQSVLENLPRNQPPAIGRDAAVMQPLIRGLLAPPPSERPLPPGYI